MDDLLPSGTAANAVNDTFYGTSPNEVATLSDFLGSSKDPHSTASTTGNQIGEGATTDSNPSTSEFDAILQEAAMLVDKKLANNRNWSNKLLQEMTLYANTLRESHAQYVRVQNLEHKESERLDQVEPDVRGATSHMLDNPLFDGSRSSHTNSVVRQPKEFTGSKRKNPDE